MDFSKFKKEISLFLSSEEAKALKSNIVKLGLSAAVIAAIMAQVSSEAEAQHGDSPHDDHSDGEHADSPHLDHSDHFDHDSHSDGTTHDDDAHSDGHGSYSDSHDDSAGAHNSDPVYDDVDRKGGHSSEYQHVNHSDSY